MEKTLPSITLYVLVAHSAGSTNGLDKVIGAYVSESLAQEERQRLADLTEEAGRYWDRLEAFRDAYIETNPSPADFSRLCDVNEMKRWTQTYISAQRTFIANDLGVSDPELVEMILSYNAWNVPGYSVVEAPLVDVEGMIDTAMAGSARPIRTKRPTVRRCRRTETAPA
jgi:hypothetical protein